MCILYFSVVLWIFSELANVIFNAFSLTHLSFIGRIKIKSIELASKFFSRSSNNYVRKNFIFITCITYFIDMLQFKKQAQFFIPFHPLDGIDIVLRTYLKSASALCRWIWMTGCATLYCIRDIFRWLLTLYF